jgi:hypothetical protein
LIKNRGIFLDKIFFCEQTTAGKHVLFKYPRVDGTKLALQIDTSDVEKKINSAEKLVHILKPYLTQ